MTPLRPAVEMSDALECDRYAAVRVPVPPSDCLSQLDFGHFCSLKKQQQTAYAEEKIISPRDCSRATGFIPLGQDEVMQGFVDGLRLELHATYPVPDAH